DLVRRHLFEDLGSLSGFERFEDADLHVGIDFAERFGGNLAIEGAYQRFAIFRTERFENVGQVGRVHFFEQPVGDVQADAPLGSRLQHVAELPSDGARGNAVLQLANGKSRQNPTKHTSKDAANADIDFEDAKLIAPVVTDF